MHLSLAPVSNPNGVTATAYNRAIDAAIAAGHTVESLRAMKINRAPEGSRARIPDVKYNRVAALSETDANNVLPVVAGLSPVVLLGGAAAVWYFFFRKK